MWRIGSPSSTRVFMCPTWVRISSADPVVIGEKRLDHAHGLGHLGPRHPLAGALEQLSRLLPALMAAAAQLPDTAPSTDEFGPEITHEAWSERFAAINGPGPAGLLDDRPTRAAPLSRRWSGYLSRTIWPTSGATFGADSMYSRRYGSASVL